MKKVNAVATDILCSLGLGVDPCWNEIEKGNSGIKQFEDNTGLSYYAGKINEQQRKAANNGHLGVLSLFEQLCCRSVERVLRQAGDAIDRSETILILSTTKGNIDLLTHEDDERTLLYNSAMMIAGATGIQQKPIVISQACISGSVALLLAHRLLSAGRYKNAVVVGADLFSPFVLNGFLSFQAIAHGPCRPFDAARTGINLGEAVASIVLSTEEGITPVARLAGGATSNVANHISGPSRTGEELAEAIRRAIADSEIRAEDVDMISAHGTATPYNDEMEAKALHLSGLSAIPLHSLKSYTGHTLGAAGVLESVMLIESIRRQQLIPSAGYQSHGVTVPVNVTTVMQPAQVRTVLKTASGFGGSNAAIVWARD